MEREVILGERIAMLREERRLSQSALARLMRSSQSAVSQIESGERNPSYETLRQIARALDVSLAHLMGADVESLHEDEKAHFRLLRSLPAEARKELEQFVQFLRQRYPPTEMT